MNIFNDCCDLCGQPIDYSYQLFFDSAGHYYCSERCLGDTKSMVTKTEAKPPLIKEVYAVNQGDDDRSNGYPKWFFSKESQAKTFAVKRGWYGSDAPVTKHFVIVVNDKLYLLDSVNPIVVDDVETQEKNDKVAALKKKLKPEEIAFLKTLIQNKEI